MIGSGKAVKSMLLVSPTGQMYEHICELLPNDEFDPIVNVSSAGEARRILSSTDFDLLVVNAPLTDEFGKQQKQVEDGKAEQLHGGAAAFLPGIGKRAACLFVAAAAAHRCHAGNAGTFFHARRHRGWAGIGPRGGAHRGRSDGSCSGSGTVRCGDAERKSRAGSDSRFHGLRDSLSAVHPW